MFQVKPSGPNAWRSVCACIRLLRTIVWWTEYNLFRSGRNHQLPLSRIALHQKYFEINVQFYLQYIRHLLPFWFISNSTYYSVTMTTSLGNSKAATSCKSFGCLRQFMMSTSSRAFSLSLDFMHLTNLAAKYWPVSRSFTLWTTP